jgi:hypothetical protein
MRTKPWRKKPSKPKPDKAKRPAKVGYVVGDDGCFELPPKKRKRRRTA